MASNSLDQPRRGVASEPPWPPAAVSGTTPTRRRFRADIQGLRAVAVLVVVVNHMFGWPVGGFVGVDIFFVISGFLITGHLMREWEKHGRISFTGFYKRRVKRILPAAVLVLVVTVVASFPVLGATRGEGVFRDGIWSLSFAANWRFASTGTDYFQADGPVSPLQHYWSLAVEEQFYFVWPWVMLIALVLLARNRTRRRGAHRQRPPARPRLVAGALILALSAASFAWALVDTAQSTTVAYFSTLTRTWELGLGALLALATPLLLRIPDALRPLLAWAGIAGMAASLFVVTEVSGFPAPAALLPVLASGLVIAAGTGGEQRFLRPLTNPVAGYIGDISFSLYLWHLPVVILLGQLMPDPGPLGHLVQLAVMFGLSIAAYHLWEDALRKSPWLEGDRSAWRTFRLPTWYRPVALSTLAAVVVAAVAATAMLGLDRSRDQAVHADQAQALERQLERERSEQPDALDDAGGVQDLDREELRAALTAGPAATRATAAVERAITDMTWGDSRSAVEAAIGNNTLPLDAIHECGSGQADPASCLFGPEDASTQVVLAGDSVSLRWVAALLPLLEKYDWRLSVQGKFACSFTDVPRAFPDEAERQACIERKDAVLGYIETEEPDLVLIANSGVPPRTEGDTTATPEQWGQGLQTYLERIQKHSQAVVVTAPPGDADMRTCLTPAAAPADCLGGLGDAWPDMTSAERAAAQATGAAFADTSDLFCAVDRCPAAVDGVPVKTDRTHITQEYAEHVSSAFGEILRAAVGLQERAAPEAG
jgi:peptidoglycan/LPS O-acetylase OafA/YrhL